MTLAWQSIGSVLIPARPAGFWSLAQEFVPGGRILRIRPANADERDAPVPMWWSPVAGLFCRPDGVPCGADGVPIGPEENPQGPNGTILWSRTGMLCSRAAYGALIGKVGGSTGDLPDTSPGTAGPYPNVRVFAVGSCVVISLPTPADGGAVFLSMNDKPEDFDKHSGELLAVLEYYPL